MPKDEFDFDDPMELNGVGLVCAEDTTDAMTECFVEEFMRLGYNPKQLLALFRNSHYLGMNLVMEKRGEQFVRDTIAQVFTRRGKIVTWPESVGTRSTASQTISIPHPSPTRPQTDQSLVTSAATNEPGAPTDPMGAPAPDVTI